MHTKVLLTSKVHQGDDHTQSLGEGRVCYENEVERERAKSESRGRKQHDGDTEVSKRRKKTQEGQGDYIMHVPEVSDGQDQEAEHPEVFRTTEAEKSMRSKGEEDREIMVEKKEAAEEAKKKCCERAIWSPARKWESLEEEAETTLGPEGEERHGRHYRGVLRDGEREHGRSVKDIESDVEASDCGLVWRKGVNRKREGCIIYLRRKMHHMNMRRRQEKVQTVALKLVMKSWAIPWQRSRQSHAE